MGGGNWISEAAVEAQQNRAQSGVPWKMWSGRWRVVQGIKIGDRAMKLDSVWDAEGGEGWV